MSKPNYQLKARIVEKFGAQVRFAEAVGLPELRISKLIHGRSKPTPEEIEIISRALQCAPHELFPEPIA